MSVLLLFPLNWSACVSAPHLALPMMSGAAASAAWDSETLDLSALYYSLSLEKPLRADVERAIRHSDYSSLDEMYFKWEDDIRRVSGRSDFQLLSGFPSTPWSSAPLSEVAEGILAAGSPFSAFYRDLAIPTIVARSPSVVGITIASSHQVVPTLELLLRLRAAMPDVYVILGGNVLTRLRESPALGVFQRLVDRLVLFQGERAFIETLDAVKRLGVSEARRRLPAMAGDESIPYGEWPCPSFEGIDLEAYPGVPALSYVSTRGCYWGRCHFCAIPAGWSTTGYGGSAPPHFVADQLRAMKAATGVSRIKFVDEAFPPAKARPLGRLLAGDGIEWEAYARLEPSWQDLGLLEEAHAGGLRKLYLGLEQAPSTDRRVLNKNDQGDVFKIMLACSAVGIKVHLFCMVGHPGTTEADADATTRFLIDHSEYIDTADLVAFRLDRGTRVPGVRPAISTRSDWNLSVAFEPTEAGVLSQEAVTAMEGECQERLWQTVPRLLHPLYRLVSPWTPAERPSTPLGEQLRGHQC